MSWFFTSDLHGQSSLYEQLLAIAAAHRPEAVIIGGDLGPHHPGEEGVRLQRVAAGPKGRHWEAKLLEPMYG